jgi:hypothetical protein
MKIRFAMLFSGGNSVLTLSSSKSNTKFYALY